MEVEKSVCRERLRHLRAQLPPEEVVRLSRQIGIHVLSFPIYRQSRTIGLYLPIDNEVDPAAILAHAQRFSRFSRFGRWLSDLLDKQIVLPVVNRSAKTLSFVRYRIGDPLQKGAYGIWEPMVGKGREPVELTQIDLLFLPLVGFDHCGTRLGYGGGYYDRLLASSAPDSAESGVIRSTPCLIGLAYAFQEVALLPRAPHDHPLHGVISEQGVFLFRADG